MTEIIKPANQSGKGFLLIEEEITRTNAFSDEAGAVGYLDKVDQIPTSEWNRSEHRCLTRVEDIQYVVVLDVGNDLIARCYVLRSGNLSLATHGNRNSGNRRH
jgi:hypothetical protein